MSFLILFAASVFIFLLVWFAIPVAIRAFKTRKLAAICRRKKAIVLTYDDGPNADISPQLADLLKKHNVPATFFLLGRNAEQHPEMLQRLLHEGHEIGSHTQHHSNAWKTNPLKHLADMQAGNTTLARLGSTTQLFRPPFGKTNFASWAYGMLKGLNFAFWTIDSRDSWDRRSVEDILEQVKSEGGGVILMHDFAQPKRGPTPESHPAYLFRLTEALIDFAAQNGFVLLHYSNLFIPLSHSDTQADS